MLMLRVNMYNIYWIYIHNFYLLLHFFLNLLYRNVFLRCIIFVQWPVQGRADAHMQHATTQQQYRTVETEVFDQKFDQKREHEATRGSAGHADSIRQCTMLVEILRYQDYTRRRRQTTADTYKGIFFSIIIR